MFVCVCDCACVYVRACVRVCECNCSCMYVCACLYHVCAYKQANVCMTVSACTSLWMHHYALAQIAAIRETLALYYHAQNL